MSCGPARVSAWLPSAFYLANSLFQQGEPFLVGADFDLPRPRPIVEGSQNLGLHVSSSFDDLVKAGVDMRAKVCKILLGRVVVIGHVTAVLILAQVAVVFSTTS